jgi:hypothetical protein
VEVDVKEDVVVANVLDVFLPVWVCSVSLGTLVRSI